MLKVGLTGSIAVGKSFVCEVLRKLGCFVIDADQTAREVVARNTQGLQMIVEKFGEEFLLENGELDRAGLGAVIFADEAKRQLLNSIVHPLVIEAQDKWLAERERENPRSIAVIEAALMIESGGYKRFTKMIVVRCEPEIQLERLMMRNKMSREVAVGRIKAQMSQEEKLRYADYVIDTSEGFDEARRQTIEVFEQLKVLI